MPRKSDDQLVLCERALTLDGRDVRIRLREPVLDPDEIWREYEPDYRCAFEIDGLSEAVCGGSRGVDCLEAIVAARTRVAYALFPLRRELRHADGLGSYEWDFAYGISLADAGRRRRIREIVDEETFAFEQFSVERDLMQRAKAAPPVPKAEVQPDVLPAHDSNSPSDPDSDAPASAVFLQPPLCTRRLQLNGTRAIDVSIWRPIRAEPVEGRDGYHCGFALIGLESTPTHVQ